ncbi:lysylphosphatidylglycerol synthase transmembrane domain-containing protein [Streptomyces sp. TS71-3]|uniref:lysylphosphatidylglycerol synthase transmembrane domain-containing protein n=1 Tax=Streptomyces sp. TS71-3 TaxID=2733862 RepID=UPI001B29A479|nr:lysylphosphatidylglycerol synthase transmembrane domain-containing protein [Streptomyces sp. TS71-3]GHJ35982.1 membrane protein [Streptomyces sp. TS71-3]
MSSPPLPLAVAEPATAAPAPPAPPPAPAAPTAPASAGRLSFPANRIKRALCLLPLLLIGAWTAFHWQVMYSGIVRLASADPLWLGVGLVFTCLCWAAASCIRQGAVLERLPSGLLYATQFAAGAANHLLPGGLGAHAVTLRFLNRRGIPLKRGTASIALYSLVKAVSTSVVTTTFLALSLHSVPYGVLLPDHPGTMLAWGGAAVGAAAVAAGLLLAFVGRLRRLVTDFLRSAFTDVRRLHTRPARVLALWGGALAFPLLQASVVASVAASLHLPLPWLDVVLAYLVANVVGGAVPSPGGLGSVDAALVLTLTIFGAPAPLAAATVIGFRVLTVWLPLLPGALTLTALVRNKVL